MTDRPYVIRRFIDDGEEDTIVVVSREITRLFAERFALDLHDRFGWLVDVKYDPDHLWRETDA